jgi:SpoIID/LytB domain protein
MRSSSLRSAPPRTLLAGALVTFALSAGVAQASTLVIAGAGDGHGVGMSQDGAFGYAEHGYSDRAILAHYYTGTTIGQAPAGFVVKVLVDAKVERVPLERYVRGVVSAEMPSSWPLAALEAQAIASRTYALTADAGGSRFDVYADTRSQVYLGAAAETATTNAAVAATAGEIVTYDGAPAITYYFASSGGMTENIENSFIGAQPEPWLEGVPDTYETGASSWKLSMSFASAAARLNGLVKGSLRGIEVLGRGISPRIVAAEVLGSRGDTPVSGPELEARLGLDSAWAYFSVKNGTRVTPEPDLSGQAPFTPATPTSPPPAPTSTTGPQGGAQAPAITTVLVAGGVRAE